MTTTKTLVSTLVAAAALLLPSLAFAGHRDGPNIGVVIAAHVHTSGCSHGQPPPPPRGVPRQSGRYELQTVSAWEPGRYENRWVAERCETYYRGRGRGHAHHRAPKRKLVCEPAHYENVWVEGQRVTTQQWVWVPAPAYHHAYPVVATTRW